MAIRITIESQSLTMSTTAEWRAALDLLAKLGLVYFSSTTVPDGERA